MGTPLHGTVVARNLKVSLQSGGIIWGANTCSRFS